MPAARGVAVLLEESSPACCSTLLGFCWGSKRGAGVRLETAVGESSCILTQKRVDLLIQVDNYTVNYTIACSLNF